MAQRSKLSPELVPIRKNLKELLPILNIEKDWYVSIFFEKKANRSFTANLKQTQVSDQMSMGAVFRIYDGYTLFEQATDDLSENALKLFAQEFAERVKSSVPPNGATRRPYSAATWTERLKAPLENEITAQIPKNPSPQTEVHFGIRFQKNPKTFSAAENLSLLKSYIERCQKAALAASFATEELSYVMARHSISEEESIFLDSETDMSQSLFRVALTLVTMSGADRTFIRMGGLGGMEALELEDQDFVTLVKDLKALKSAHRLEPGKYRVLFGPTLTGVLAHEAFGHSQEADTCARGRSKAWDLHQSGQSVGNQHATILNNPAIFESGDEKGSEKGALYAAWGSYFFDEEGWLAQSQILLDQGQLKAPMTNLTSAIRLGVPRTANGKRESWANGVYTRQTNTYFSPGQKTLPELMGQLKDGFLALHPAGGMEDPKGMGIQVGISYLQEVKDGKTTGKVFKGPAGGDIQMTGYTPDILNSIVDKSKIEFNSSAPDRMQHPFNDAGGCGKYHKEFVYAGCGGPYVLLDHVTLG